MAERSASRGILVIVGVLVAASSLSGLAYAVITSDDYERRLRADQEADQRRIADWCDNVTGSIGPDQTFPSFTALIEAARAGDLATPSIPPPTSSATALDRWQRDHEGFVASAYLAGLEGYPKEFGFEDATLKAILADARAGETVAVAPQTARRAGRLLDQFVKQHC